MSARLSEDRAHVLGTGVEGAGLDRLGNAHGQHAARMKGLTQAGVVEAQITCYRVNLLLRPCPDTVDGTLHLLE